MPDPTMPTALAFTLTVDGPVDASGRVPFTLDWHEDGRPRGQCFRAYLAPFVRDTEARGHSVAVHNPHGYPTEEVSRG